MDRNPIAARVLAVGAIFLVGFVEAMILRSRFAASVTWLIGLAATCIWIAGPVTPGRVFAALTVFSLGAVGLTMFYRGKSS